MPNIDGFEEKLRDEFAGRAMQAIISSVALPENYIQSDMKICAQASYMMAEAMLLARQEMK